MTKHLLILFFSITSYVAYAEIPQTSPPVLKLNDALPSNLFVELSKAINPSVVNISTSQIPNRRQRYRDPMLEFLEQFYGMQMGPRPDLNKPQQMSLGTGFIIRDDGLILTNNHVIEGADIINVQVLGKTKKTFEAELVGSDRRTDIALIKIKADRKLPAVALGTSKDLEVGEWVAAFGNPFGHDHTMTKGIISSKGRSIAEINKIPLLQTDASINPGNSGGPLVNTKGLVVGVNSAIDARAQGIGFAIPIDEVKAILPRLEKSGRIEKGYIGTALGDLDPSAAESLKIDGGAVIVDVERGGPASKAGLKHYDIVVEFNGKPITRAMDLIDAVSDAPIGKNSQITVLRNSKKITLNIPIAEHKESKPAATRHEDMKKYSGTNAPYNLGFAMTDLNNELRSQWQLPEELKKPIVTSTERKGLASMGGLRVGDVILNINNNDIETTKDAIKAINKNQNIFRIARGGQVIIIQIATGN